MTGEVVAACEGACDAGATEIWVRDAHWTARNLILEDLPDYVQIIRGYNGHPMEMLFDLDASFDALAFIGFHDRAGSEESPLAHTITETRIDQIFLNGIPASEALFLSYAAEFIGVPCCFISGDRGICTEAKAQFQYSDG